MNLVTVVGARPQLIKEAVLQNEIKKHKEINHIFIHTGQHYDVEMSDIFLEQLKIKKPDYFLNINQVSSPKLISQIIMKLEEIFYKVNPDYVIVYGDTDSTLATAITAKKMNLKLVHIESGLRQNPKSMPEEINRVLTDHSSTLLFTSSNTGVVNLNSEGITKNIFNVGDMMYDLFLHKNSCLNDKYLKDLKLIRGNYILFTLHRNFNVDDENNLRNILEVMKKVGEKITVVFPIHPRTKDKIKTFNLERLIDKFIVTKPLDYCQLLSLAKYSKKIVTDSGGLQKESYFVRKNAIVLMEDTGWNELIDLNYNCLVDVRSDFSEIVLDFSNDISIRNIYGDGTAAKKIISIIMKSGDSI